jgi:uncharacterized protein (DUF2132 family)
LSKEQINNPLHGKTLEYIVNELVEQYGWVELGARIDIRCFNKDPSVKSSLKFLRKKEWARNMVEKLYLDSQKETAQEKDTVQPKEKFKWK